MSTLAIKTHIEKSPPTSNANNIYWLPVKAPDSSSTQEWRPAKLSDFKFTGNDVEQKHAIQTATALLSRLSVNSQGEIKLDVRGFNFSTRTDKKGNQTQSNKALWEQMNLLKVYMPAKTLNIDCRNCNLSGTRCFDLTYYSPKGPWGGEIQTSYPPKLDLRGANLSGADLGGAYLVDSLLDGANLKGADLSGSVVSSDQLSRARNAPSGGVYKIPTDGELPIGLGLKGAVYFSADINDGYAEPKWRIPPQGAKPIKPNIGVFYPKYDGTPGKLQKYFEGELAEKKYNPSVVRSAIDATLLKTYP